MSNTWNVLPGGPAHVPPAVEPAGAAVLGLDAAQHRRQRSPGRVVGRGDLHALTSLIKNSLEGQDSMEK